MNSEQFLQHIEDFYQKNLETTRKKNHDYAGDSNVFRSFMVTEFLENTTVEEGFIVRMGDKLSRLATLVKKEALVDESINDTLSDLANYCAILSAYLESKKHANR
jgi:hypothetical protein